jgi:hypothetical protein
MTAPVFGRTIQLYLVDGVPSGLTIASIHGWTGSVLVGTQSTFARLLARPETDRTGVYILYGPDPDDALSMRAYVGEADSVRERINQSAANRGFWETAVVITTSDEALTKGHVRYLEARLLELATEAGRVKLDNAQNPASERRRLPESDLANMEAFLANLKVVLPVIGLELLKPKPRAAQVAPSGSPTPMPVGESVRFTIKHKSRIAAFAVEEDGEFVVLEGSEALKETGFVSNTYGDLKAELIQQGILSATPDGQRWRFIRAHAFKSPSAASAVVLDRNSNGRLEWKVDGGSQTYGEWQAAKAVGVAT